MAVGTEAALTGSGYSTVLLCKLEQVPPAGWREHCSAWLDASKATFLKRCLFGQIQLHARAQDLMRGVSGGIQSSLPSMLGVIAQCVHCTTKLYGTALSFSMMVGSALQARKLKTVHFVKAGARSGSPTTVSPSTVHSARYRVSI